MSTEEGKEKILNPIGHTPILKCMNWTECAYAENVNERVCLYLKNFLESEDTEKKFKEIAEELRSTFDKLSSTLKGIEDDTDLPEKFKDEKKDQTTSSAGPHFADRLLNVPIVIGGFFLSAALLCLAIVLSPIIIAKLVYQNQEEEKRRIIDRTYQECTLQVRNKVCETLESSYGFFVGTLIESLMFGVLDRKIKSFLEMINNLKMFREEYLSKTDEFCELKRKVEEMEEEATSLEECLGETPSCTRI